MKKKPTQKQADDIATAQAFIEVEQKRLRESVRRQMLIEKPLSAEERRFVKYQVDQWFKKAKWPRNESPKRRALVRKTLLEACGDYEKLKRAAWY